MPHAARGRAVGAAEGQLVHVVGGAAAASGSSSSSGRLTFDHLGGEQQVLALVDQGERVARARSSSGSRRRARRWRSSAVSASPVAPLDLVARRCRRRIVDAHLAPRAGSAGAVGSRAARRVGRARRSSRRTRSTRGPVAARSPWQPADRRLDCRPRPAAAGAPAAGSSSAAHRAAWTGAQAGERAQHRLGAPGARRAGGRGLAPQRIGCRRRRLGAGEERRRARHRGRG